MGIIQGVSVHSIHKGEVLVFSRVRKPFKKAIKNLEVNVDSQKGALRFRGKMTKDVLVSSKLCFHPLSAYGNNSQRHVYAITSYLFHDLHFFLCSGGIYHIKLKR